MSIITLATANFVIEEFCVQEFVHVILAHLKTPPSREDIAATF